jgi:hypothetical protein
MECLREYGILSHLILENTLYHDTSNLWSLVVVGNTKELVSRMDASNTGSFGLDGGDIIGKLISKEFTISAVWQNFARRLGEEFDGTNHLLNGRNEGRVAFLSLEHISIPVREFLRITVGEQLSSKSA